MGDEEKGDFYRTGAGLFSCIFIEVLKLSLNTEFSSKISGTRI